MINSFKKFITLLAITLCCWVTYHATRLAIADIIHYPVKNWIESVDITMPISEFELIQAEDKILKSIRFNPDNAEYWEYLGRIHYLRAISHYQDDSLFNKFILMAYHSHKKAISLRPQWPYSWANLALMKSHLQQLDVEYLYAVNQAVLYGPWEIASNEAIVQAGFNGWRKLNINSRNMTTEALERVYQQAPKAARALLAHYSRQATVCPMLVLDKFRQDKICKDIPLFTPSTPNR
ncbi:MAG: hypothetical protein OFPI_00570 [Osedax symbiont Rs2]|nr:MAG: hypothetical protein OFPI_00570 [Osedax symbiont Rs2]